METNSVLIFGPGDVVDGAFYHRRYTQIGGKRTATRLFARYSVDHGQKGSVFVVDYADGERESIELRPGAFVSIVIPNGTLEVRVRRAPPKDSRYVISATFRENGEVQDGCVGIEEGCAGGVPEAKPASS